MKRMFFLVWALAIGATGSAEVPDSGVWVEDLSWIDDAVQDYMTTNEIRTGLIGVMRNGSIIYQRGFGWKDKDRTIELPENALVRLASCTKPITAAAIRKLEAAGKLSTNDFVFNLGQMKPGIIDVSPFPKLTDGRLTNVTVQHCLEHSGGWNGHEDDYDLGLQPCDASSALGVSSPPGVSNTIAWALGKRLDWDPGDTNGYSNFDYMVLGAVIEKASGSDVISCHRKYVLTPEMWVPKTDLLLGETFAEYQPLREPWYDSGGDESECVFPLDLPPIWFPGCSGVNVDTPYGGWDHASFVGFGGVVASAAPVLELAERYIIGDRVDADVGMPLPATRVDREKGGTFSGTSTYLTQRKDGINVFIFFNKVSTETNVHFARTFYKFAMETNLTDQVTWPTTCVSGFWVDPDRIVPGEYGSYDSPFADLHEALDYVADGSRVNFKEGTSNWTGTISTKVELRAPFGSVQIGAHP